MNPLILWRIEPPTAILNSILARAFFDLGRRDATWSAYWRIINLHILAVMTPLLEVLKSNRSD